MSETGFRGLMARFFGGKGQQEESETRQSLERATGADRTAQRPSPAEDEVDHGDIPVESRKRRGR